MKVYGRMASFFDCDVYEENWKKIVASLVVANESIGRQIVGLEKVKLVKNGINQQLFIKTLMIRFLNNIGHFALSRYYVSNNKLSE